MKLQLHNKIEIFQGGKVITAYNTMLKPVYGAIAELKDYFTYMAVGTGTGASSFDMTALENYSASVLLQTEDVSCDILADTMFVKKSYTFGENDYAGLKFSEIGIAATDEENPTIYNRILVTDDEGNVLTVEKRDGESLTVRITIYLEVDSGSRNYFTTGYNPLLLQLMGESGSLEKSVYAIRGILEAENDAPIERTVPQGKQTKCKLEITGAEESDFALNIVASLGTGDTREVVFVYGGKAVARVNVRGFGTESEETYFFTTDEFGNFILPNKFLEFKSAKVYSTGEAVDLNDFRIEKIAKKVGEKVPDLPTFSTASYSAPTASSKILLGADGNTFAIGVGANNASFAVFKVDGGKVKLLTSSAPGDSEYRKVKFFNGDMYFYNNVSKCFGVYEIDETGVKEKDINNDMLLSSYDMSTVTDFDCFINSSGKLVIGTIVTLDSGKKIGICAFCDKNEDFDGWTVSHIEETTIDGVGKVLGYPAECGLGGQMIFFANNNTSTESAYATELIGEESHEILSDTEVASYAFYNTLIRIDPIKGLLFYNLGNPSMNSAKVFDMDKKAWTGMQVYTYFQNTYNISRDGMYFAEKSYDGLYEKLLYRKTYNNFGEFEDSLGNNASSIKEIIFTNDYIIYFIYSAVNDNYYLEAYTYDKCGYKLTSDYKSINFQTTTKFIDYLGDDEFQGVEVKFVINLAPPKVSE